MYLVLRIFSVKIFKLFKYSKKISEVKKTMPCVPIGIMKGVKGDTGLRGEKGEKGDRGEQGIQGPAGRNGADGTTDTPSQVLSKLKNVDGKSSGLDADLLDGHDSSYFATEDDITTVEQYQLHSKFNLWKRAGTVQLTVDDWDGVAWLAGRTGWQTIFSIPQGFRPAVPVSGVTNIYCPNLFGASLRVRINCRNNQIQIYYDGGDAHNFYGTVTWITDE